MDIPSDFSFSSATPDIDLVRDIIDAALQREALSAIYCELSA
jgi:hypothetical protein